MWLCRCEYFPQHFFLCAHSILFHFHNCQHKRYRTLYAWHASENVLLFVYALCVWCINIYCTNNKVINSTTIHIITMTIHSPCCINSRHKMLVLLVYNVSKCVDTLFGAFGNNSLRFSKDWRTFIREIPVKNHRAQNRENSDFRWGSFHFNIRKMYPFDTLPLKKKSILTHKCGFHFA